jgi:hypothetical protein
MKGEVRGKVEFAGEGVLRINVCLTALAWIATTGGSILFYN